MAFKLKKHPEICKAKLQPTFTYFHTIVDDLGRGGNLRAIASKQKVIAGEPQLQRWAGVARAARGRREGGERATIPALLAQAGPDTTHRGNCTEQKC